MSDADEGALDLGGAEDPLPGGLLVGHGDVDLLLRLTGRASRMSGSAIIARHPPAGCVHRVPVERLPDVHQA